MKFYLSPGQVRHYERRPFEYMGVKYTKHGATRAKFLELGFTEVTLQARPDDRYYIVSGPDNNGAYSATERPLDELKASAISQVKQDARQQLRDTDWLVIRGVEEPGKPVKQAVKVYRAAIRVLSSTREDQINACSTVEELAQLGPVAWPEVPADVPEDEPPA